MSLTEDQVFELQRSFHAFDTNGSGFIELDELKEGLKLLGYDISDKGMTHLLSLVESKDDRLDFEEFIAWNGLLWKDEMKAKFRKIDSDNSGWIGKSELQQWALDMGYGFTETGIDDMCYEMDSSGDDKISVDEFIKGMVRTRTGDRNICGISYAYTKLLRLKASSREGNSYFVINGELYIQKLKADFRAMDVDNSGFVTRANLKEMAGEANYILSKEELDQTIQSMDSDGDGQISIEEFVASAVRMALELQTTNGIIVSDL